MKKKFALALFSRAVGACTSNANEAENKSISSAIVSGDADVGDPAVVAVGPRRVHCGDTLQPFCSGVLIASQVVLTAAHCFLGHRPGEPYEVFFGNDVTGTGDVHGVTRVVTPDGYDGGNGGGDLALLFLDAPVDASVVTIGSVDETDVGKTVTMVGFGIANPDDGGSRRTPASMRISRASSHHFGDRCGRNATSDSTAPASADGSGHCTLNGLPPGDFGARLASGPSSCFCLTACSVVPPNLDAAPDANISSSPSTSSGCSCRSTVNSARSSDALVFPIFVLGALLRKRKRSLT